MVQQFDDLESSREGAGQRDTSLQIVRKHLEDIGLDGDIAQYNEINGLSGGTDSWFMASAQMLRSQLNRSKDQAGHCRLSLE